MELAIRSCFINPRNTSVDVEALVERTRLSFALPLFVAGVGRGGSGNQAARDTSAPAAAFDLGQIRASLV